MRPNAAEVRETLDAAALPAEFNTELNHRTCVTSAWDDTITLLRVLFVASMIAIPFTILAQFAGRYSFAVALSAFSAALGLLVVALVRYAFTAQATESAAWAGLLGACGCLVAVMGWFSDPGTAYLVLFTASVGFAYVVTYFVAKQAAFWMSAHPLVPSDTMFGWQERFPPLSVTHEDREFPEASNFTVGLYALVAGWVFAFAGQRILLHTPLATFSGPLVLLLFVFATLAAWFPLHQIVFRRSAAPLAALRAAFRALRTFACYNRHAVPAAGVFRFPTRLLRPSAARDTVLFVTMLLFVLAIVGMTTTAVTPTSALPEKPPANDPAPDLTLDAVELDFINSHPEPMRTALEMQSREEKLAHWRAAQAAKQQAYKQNYVGVATKEFAKYPLAILVATLAPPLLLLLVLVVSSGSLLTIYDQALERPGAEAQSKCEPWEIAVERITHSEEARERQHLLLGYATLHDYPVLLHRHLLNNHAHITGDTGARKTALAIAPLATQLIAAVDKELACSVVILDLKGEDWLFHTVYDEAKRAGRKFRWFTTFPNATSHVFNPFLQSHWSRLSPEQCSQVILQALSLDYGLGYGRGFFSAMNETVLLTLLREYEIKSFRDLFRELEDSLAHTSAGGKAKDWQDARHLTALVNRLAAAHALNLTEADLEQKPEAWQNAINMPDLFDEPQVVYFHLPSPVEPVGAPSIAKLALYSLFTAAAQRTGKRKQVYVFIDEFQQVISDSIRLILEQARSKGLSLILSHQTAGQLDRNGTDLTETVDSCTAFKQVLKASDTRAAKRLAEGSGQALYETRGTTFAIPLNGDARQAQVAKIEIGEQIGPRLEPNTIIEVSADPMASMVRFTEGSEYTQFSGYWTTIMSQYHQSEDEFEARASRAWPSETPDTVPVLAEQLSLTVAAAQQKAKRRADSGGPTNATEDDAEPDVVPFKDWDHKLSRRPPQ